MYVKLFKARRFHSKVPLAELLEKVAIIGVLVAISIPIFTSQLEKSRDAVTIANLRSAYAETSALMIVAPESTTAKSGNAEKTAANTVKVTNVNIPCTDGNADLSELPFTTTLPTSAKKNATVTFEFNTTTGGAPTVTVA